MEVVVTDPERASQPLPDGASGVERPRYAGAVFDDRSHDRTQAEHYDAFVEECCQRVEVHAGYREIDECRTRSGMKILWRPRAVRRRRLSRQRFQLAGEWTALLHLPASSTAVRFPCRGDFAAEVGVLVQTRPVFLRGMERFCVAHDASAAGPSDEESSSRQVTTTPLRRSLLACGPHAISLCRSKRSCERARAQPSLADRGICGVGPWLDSTSV